MTGWTYHRLYPADWAGADAALIHLAAVLGRPDAQHPWFLLRYQDEGGLHLRVRLHESHPLAGAGLEDLLQGALHAAAQPVGGEEVERLRFVRLPEPPAPPPTVARLVADQYAPEHEKYGDGAMLEAAHRLFVASSAVALDLLILRRDGAGPVRPVVPHLFAAAVRQGVAPGREAAFLDRFCDFWLGFLKADIDTMRRQFTNHHALLRQRRAVIVAEPDALAAPCMAALRHWQQALVALRQDMRALGADAPRLERLAGNAIHLMNNRLGLTVMDEAWLSFLLKQRVRIHEPA